MTAPDSHTMSRIALRRAIIVFTGFALLASAVLYRAWTLQVEEPEKVLSKRDWRLRTHERLVAPRGQIQDRNGHVLAESVQAYNVFLDVRGLYRDFPNEVEPIRALLSTVPGIDSGEFARWDNTDIDSLTRHYRLARQLSPKRWRHLEAAEDELGINVFYSEPVFRRFYPEEELAGNLLGFVASDGVEGRAGVESGMDEVLRGDTVEYVVERDMRRKAYLFGEIPDLNAIAGGGVQLTIDARLQEFVERELESVTEQFEAREAMAIVSDVESGELLAMASWPPFNPNHPFDFPEDRLWVSRPASHAYEPGSTAKVVTFAAALNEGLVGWDDVIDCENGYIEIDGERVGDTHPEEELPAWKVLQVSSNIGSLKIGMRLSDARHYEYLKAFGFGEPTGIDIQGEGAGILEAPPWIDIKQANMAFGHGFAATALQVHTATSTIANDGVRLRPRLVRAVQRSDGSIERRRPVVEERVIRPEVARTVTRALETVVEGEDGTGKEAAIDGVRVAGKTGTANLVDPTSGGYTDEYLSSFSGYLPADDPRYAITVWVLEPNKEIEHYGGRVAAPAFRRIGMKAMELLDAENPDLQPESLAEAVARFDARREEVESAEESGSESPERAAPATDGEGTEVSEPDNAETVPDFRGLWARQAIRRARSRGLHVQFDGTGVVVDQSVPAGDPLDGVDEIALTLGAEEVAHAP
jgi:cell division protein FtsI (penicillin-binding protein 3)